MQLHLAEQPACWRFPAVRYVVGGLLLLAGGLEVYGLGVSTVPTVGPWSSSAIQSFVILWELALGAWLVSGAAAGAAWLAALGTFLTFAAIIGYLGWIGVASCGCFGAVPASPWAAFGVDVVVLAAIRIAGPNWQAVRQGIRTDLRRLPTGFAGILLGAGLVLAIAVGVATFLYGSPAAALSRAQGVHLYTPGYVDFGTGRPGDVLERTIEVTNWTPEPVRLIGGTSDCSCITTANMPVTIDPGVTAVVPVRLKVPESASGAFTRRAELWTDSDRQRSIGFTIGCRVE